MGEKASYSAKHSWISRLLGKPQICQECGTTDSQGKKRWFEWANLSGQYLRIVEDWKRLCIPCHYELDRERRLNAKLRSDNSSGCKGVSWKKQDKNWEVRVQRKGERVHLGRFKTLEEAVEARADYLERAKKDLMGE